MFLKTRIRVCRQDQVEPITEFLLDKELAQNVTLGPLFLTGDFVSSHTHHGETVGYLDKVKRLQEEFEVEAEIVIG